MAGGGIGEAMLFSAAMGGGTAALTGGDPLKGALLGGLTGGIGSGIGGMLGGAAPAAGLAAAEAAPAAAMTSMAPTVANAAAMNAATAPTALSGLSGAPSALGSGTFGILPEAAPGITGLPNAVASAATPPPNAYFNQNTISQAQDGLIRANSGYNPALPTQQQQNLLPPIATPQTAPGITGLPNATPANLFKDPMKYLGENKFLAGSSALAGAVGGREEPEGPEEYNGPLKRFRFNPETYRPAFAEGGITDLASGGYDRTVGDESMNPAFMARGGISDLGGYSDYARGGRMLRGPGDGMSDSIPASIAGKRPARLADNEFVVPADVVSHIGNGSSDAGAKQLYAMMDRIRKARTGRKSQGRQINPRRYMPA